VTQLPLAIVGGGRMGRLHLRACRHAPGVRPVAVVDPDPAARDALAGDGVAALASVEEMLAAAAPRAALVAAPSDQHRDLVAALTGAGLPVLCEKPCGVTAADVREAAATAERSGVLLQVGYWRRFVPALARLRERIAAGELGAVSLIACNQWDEHPPPEEFRLHSGGIAVDMGVHELDQLRWLTGQEIERVTALAGDLEGGPEDPDTAAALVALSGGTLGVATLGRRFGQPDSCWLEALGSGGYAREQFMWAQDGERVFLAALAAQLEAFAAAVADGRPRGAGGADAVAAMTAAEAMHEALAGAAAEAAPGA
jgi:myo-inositol 2-dehydrogenase/D-chiro-inositol 1-dehydrogenase